MLIPRNLSTMSRREAITHAAWVALLPGAIIYALLDSTGYIAGGLVGADSHAYWVAARDASSWYTEVPGQRDAYLYSPLFAQLLWPWAQLSWPVAQATWMAAQLAVLVWLVRPLGWWRGTAVALFVVVEILLGNVYLFLAALLVLAVAGRGEALLGGLLTKVTPAVTGLWFVVRRDWTTVRRMAVVGAVVVGTSVVLAPGAWWDWLAFLATQTGTGDGLVALLRLSGAVVLVVVAAHRDRSVLLAPAMLLANPMFGGWNVLALLLCLPRLALRDRRVRAEVEQPVTAVLTLRLIRGRTVAIPFPLAPRPAVVERAMRRRGA